MTRNPAQKVMFVCPNLETGGAERQWAILIRGLFDQGFDVSVLTLDGRGAYFDELRAAGVPIACAALRHRADPVGLARAAWLGRSWSATVVTRGFSAHMVGHVLAQGHRAAHVLTEHSVAEQAKFGPPRRHQQLLIKPIRPRANCVVAVTASQVEYLVSEGYRRDAIRVIGNGVPNDPPVRDREAVRAELGVSRGDFLAVLMAWLRPEKRVPAFVEQVTAAHSVEPRVKGLVVGDGPDYALVARATAESGGVVRMLGERVDALDIMHAADVVCLTSVAEALPMSVLEAMSLGRPVIATRVGGVPEAVKDGETGILVPPDCPSEVATALVYLARDPARANELGSAGRARQQWSFSEEAMTRGYADLLTDLGCSSSRGLRAATPAAATR
jgi:glycosyltransferase involved in cell wall biosynthesis